MKTFPIKLFNFEINKEQKKRLENKNFLYKDWC